MWNGEQYVHVKRNTSRRTQAVKETTLRRGYELARDVYTTLDGKLYRFDHWKKKSPRGASDE